MKKYLHLFIIIVAGMMMSACVPEDDLDEIFVGKTWYMVGGRLNSQDLNKEVANFYQYGTGAYTINFQSGTLKGTLSQGINFTGNWHAIAKSRNITFTFKEGTNTSLPFDHNVFTILRGITSYEGDTNYLILYADQDNFIRLNCER